jgi:hypothetical protein
MDMEENTWNELSVFTLQVHICWGSNVENIVHLPNVAVLKYGDL